MRTTTTARRKSTKTGTKTATKLFATIALVASAGAVAGIGTFGAYTDTTTADLSVGSAKVSILMNDSDHGIHVDATNMVAGDKVVFPISIKRAAGSAELGDLTVQTTVTNQNALTSALRLTVDSCSKAWTVGASTVTCSGTTSNVATDAGLVWNGTTAQWDPTKGWVSSLNSSNPVYLRATVSLPSTAGNSTAGLTTGITWTLTGTQRTAKTTVVNP